MWPLGQVAQAQVEETAAGASVDQLNFTVVNVHDQLKVLQEMITALQSSGGRSSS